MAALTLAEQEELRDRLIREAEEQAQRILPTEPAPEAAAERLRGARPEVPEAEDVIPEGVEMLVSRSEPTGQEAPLPEEYERRDIDVTPPVTQRDPESGRTAVELSAGDIGPPPPEEEQARRFAAQDAADRAQVRPWGEVPEETAAQLIRERDAYQEPPTPIAEGLADPWGDVPEGMSAEEYEAARALSVRRNNERAAARDKEETEAYEADIRERRTPPSREELFMERLMSDFERRNQRAPISIGSTARGRQRSALQLRQRQQEDQRYRTELAGIMDTMQNQRSAERAERAIGVQEGQLAYRGKRDVETSQLRQEEEEAKRARDEAGRQQAQANVERRFGQRDTELEISQQRADRQRRRGGGGGGARATQAQLRSSEAPDVYTRNYVRNRENALGARATDEQREGWTTGAQEIWSSTDEIGRRGLLANIDRGTGTEGRQGVQAVRRQAVQVARSTASNREISRAVGHVIDWEQQIGAERFRTAVMQLNAIQPGDPIPERALNADAQELRARASGVINRELLERSGAAVTDTEWARYRAEIGNFRTSNPTTFINWFHRFDRDLSAARSVLEAGFLPNTIEGYYSRLDPSAGGTGGQEQEEQAPATFTVRRSDGTEAELEESPRGRAAEEQLRARGVIE